MTDITPSPFDLDALRVTGSINTIGAKPIFYNIAVRKPNKQEFFRVNTDPEYSFQCGILELKDEREHYLVTPNMIPEMAEDVRVVELTLCTSRQGVPFLWPIPMPDETGRLNPWHQSAREASEFARKKWIRMIADMSAGSYSLHEASAKIPDPEWPDKTMRELIEIAFKNGRLIDSPDHPVIVQLRGG
jgi:hypothetical protein